MSFGEALATNGLFVNRQQGQLSIEFNERHYAYVSRIV